MIVCSGNPLNSRAMWNVEVGMSTSFHHMCTHWAWWWFPRRWEETQKFYFNKMVKNCTFLAIGLPGFGWYFSNDSHWIQMNFFLSDNFPYCFNCTLRADLGQSLVLQSQWQYKKWLPVIHGKDLDWNPYVPCFIRLRTSSCKDCRLNQWIT